MRRATLLIALVLIVAFTAAARTKTRSKINLKGLVEKIVKPIKWILPDIKLRMPRHLDLSKINASNCIRFSNVAKLISTLKGNKAGWEAAHNDFSCWQKEDMSHLAGLKLEPPKGHRHSYNAQAGAMHVLSDAEQAAIPANFDASQQWQGCIADIRNQLQCGSCWAFSGASTLSDRICIKTRGKIAKLVLSPQQLVSCSENKGCNGGQMNTFWTFAQNTGIVPETCMPYVSGNNSVPVCPAKCASGASFGTPYTVNPPANKFGGHLLVPYKPADWRTNVPLMQKEIMTNGPIQVAFTVPKEFMNYKSGVYKCVNCADTVGGHAVKLYGWGTAQDGTKYWLMANSWGERWGINGNAQFAMGQLGIEDYAYGAIPTISSDATTTPGPATPKPPTQSELDQQTSVKVFNLIKGWFATNAKKTLTLHQGANDLCQRQSNLIASGKEPFGSGGWTSTNANWPTARWTSLVNQFKVKGGFETNGWRSGDASIDDFAQNVYNYLITIQDLSKYSGIGIGISTDKDYKTYYIVEFVM